MNAQFTLRKSALAFALLGASTFAFAADEMPANPIAGTESHHRHFDPVAHAQHNLDRLASKLNLMDDQRAAWEAYVDRTISRAKEKATKMEGRHLHKGQPRIEVDTATRLDQMAQAMRERADRLQSLAQDARTLEAVLSTDQKTIFDLYWKSEWHTRMSHRGAA